MNRLFPSLSHYVSDHKKKMDRPLRICIATPDILGPIKTGGIGTAYANLAQVLTDRGHKVTILYLLGVHSEEGKIDAWVNEYAKNNIEFISFTSRDFGLQNSSLRNKNYQIYQWFLEREHDFDVVHFPEWQGMGYYTMLAKHQGLAFQNTLFCVGTHSPTMWHTFGEFELLNKLSQLELDFMERQSVELADVVISPSQYMLQWMLDNEWKLPEHCFVQPNVLPKEFYKESILSESNSPAHFNEIVFFGRLERRKGIELFCTVLNKIPKEKLANMKVTFLGKGSTIDNMTSEEYLKMQFKNAAFSWKIMNGKSRDEALAYLQQPERLAVVASLVENSPFTVLECLAKQIHFIATDVGGIKELINEEDWLKVCFKPSVQDLKTTLMNAIEHGISTAKPAVSYADNAKTWVDWHEVFVTSLSDQNQTSEKNELPLVSVCVSHFNRPKLLSQLLDSLRVQTYSNFEVVLVDDGSTNQEAIQYLDSLSEEFNQRGWKIIKQENRYLGAARNTAAKNSRGKYLIFMDDDNVAMPDQLSTFVLAAEKSKADILTSMMFTFEGADPPDVQSNALFKWLPLGQAIALGFYENCYGDANALVKRESFEAIGGFTEDYGVGHEDWEFFAKASLQGYKLQVVPKLLFCYRIQQNSMFRTGNTVKNLRRNIRPYLADLPYFHQQILHYTQGQSCKFSYYPAEFDRYWYSWSWRLTSPIRAIRHWIKGWPPYERPVISMRAEEQIQIDELISSFSWKISKPIRWLENRFKKVIEE